MFQPISSPRIWNVASSSDCVAVAISPKWNSTVTRAAGLTLIFSARSASDEPWRSLIVWPLPLGMRTPPMTGAFISSYSWRFARRFLRAFEDLPPWRPNAPAAPPRPRPPPRDGPLLLFWKPPELPPPKRLPPGRPLLAPPPWFWRCWPHWPGRAPVPGPGRPLRAPPRAPGRPPRRLSFTVGRAIGCGRGMSPGVGVCMPCLRLNGLLPGRGACCCGAPGLAPPPCWPLPWGPRGVRGPGVGALGRAFERSLRLVFCGPGRGPPFARGEAER